MSILKLNVFKHFFLIRITSEMYLNKTVKHLGYLYIIVTCQ